MTCTEYSKSQIYRSLALTSHAKPRHFSIITVGFVSLFCILSLFIFQVDLK